MYTIRERVDAELSKRVGTWFTLREIQEAVRVNPATLKPMIMKYAKENILRRRAVRGAARAVQFSPASSSKSGFKTLLTKTHPYRNFLTKPFSRWEAIQKGSKIIKKNRLQKKKGSSRSGKRR